jgi:hypothetical protein
MNRILDSSFHCESKPSPEMEFQDEIETSGGHNLLHQFMVEEGVPAVGGVAGEVHLGFVAGIVQRERILPFEKVS